ncbi:unnamed protein product, partial [Rotaria sp. Silwood1]
METSLKYFQKQLNNQACLSPLSRINMLYAMGLCFMKKSYYSQALEKFLEAKLLLENHPPPYDRFVHLFSTLFNSIALVHALLKDNFKALIMLKKALDICTSFNT